MAIALANSCSPTRLGFPMDEKGPKQSVWHRLGLRRWLGRDDRDSRNQDALFPHNHNRATSIDSNKQDNLTRRLSRRVGVGLPMSGPFKRPTSEQSHDQLAPLKVEPQHRRAQSADRRPLSAQRTRSPPPAVGPRLSAPEVQWIGPTTATTVDEPLDRDLDDLDATLDLDPDLDSNNEIDSQPDWDSSPDLTTTAPESAPPPNTLEMELEHRWILNLSMHFRDRSEREKFFVTYAETPTRWRRVTISCDYRGATEDSLEQDLKDLRYQRDKCARIYESIRESLPQIQFYDTVTNLKVETSEGRLHVHVTEDVNEMIPYPPISSIGHLRGARCVPENLLHFESHLSGFVYKVQLGGHAYIKKEIPGPDTVDEFLYEINALHALNGAPNVIQVEAIVVDERQEVVKGLLINYAAQGALVDILYDQRGDISFARRERWAKQIVQGLCEIHESGYVQGDFTLSNIVVDGNDNAHIIDINRRGCPVGWEPPEIAAKIESNQRISMYIGVKTDLYQLGMTLWALAMEEDEPERQPRPLLLGLDADVPDYYRRVVDICLSPTPRHRLSAKDLLTLFPTDLFSRSLPAGRVRDTTGQDLRPLITKGNGSDAFPVAVPVNRPFEPLTPFKNEFPKTHNGMPQPIFSSHHDQGKGSTPTLAGSNGGATFLSRHSSASTLNHHEIHDSGRRWDEFDESDDEYDEAESHPARNVEQPVIPPVDATPMEYSSSAPSIDQDSINWDGHPLNRESIPVSAKPVERIPISSSEDGPIDQSSERPVSISKLTETEPAMPFLFGSILPINPSLQFSRHRPFPSVAKNTQPLLPPPRESIVDTSALLQHMHLSQSQLPINPAFEEEEEKEERKSFSAELDLLKSRLPLNPAVQNGSSKLMSPNLKPQSFTSTSISTGAIIETNTIKLPPLAHSCLPINPAAENGSVGPIPLPGVSQLSIVNDLPSPLIESRLPINPAAEKGYARVVPSTRESQVSAQRITANAPGLNAIVGNEDASLGESRLPINPAVEDGPMTNGSSPFEPKSSESRTPEKSPIKLVPTILESQMPTDTTVKDGSIKFVLSPVKSQLTSSRAPDNRSARLNHSLVDSRLPINPSSRDSL
ncbi:hypothetical protein N7466_008142 [Penicillium verhagenii]|uniref:uncharacterized protein n=1 Tax=Penicillium verhagenii TaxID=1562060 RepID=UPI00254577CE|nr:uncharacterized protein N7466_008142 [Penicillium verhagenii]KAJ5923955.1 hypothetical protein N7466_008142 [Penicillium verhagenii]